MSVQSTQQQTPSESVNVAQTLTEEQTARRDAFVGRIFQSSLAGLEMLTVYLGNRLGLYQALAPPLNSRRATTPASATSANGWSSRPQPIFCR